MNDELKNILDEFMNFDFNSQWERMEINEYERNILKDYITNLQQRVEQYENPDDMTLFYMWLDEKAKDKMKNLQQENEKLKEKSINEVLKNDFDMCVKDLKKANKKIEKLEDYKSCCEKAVEYINENGIYKKFRFNERIYYSEYLINQVLNILNGRSDE